MNRDIQVLLADYVKEHFGAPVRNQNDCQILSERIEFVTARKISSHTLRRFFSLVKPGGNFSLTTMDTLSNFIGHSNFEAFKEYIQKEEETLEIVLDPSHNESDLELYFLAKLMSKRISLESCMMLAYAIKQKLQLKEYDRAINLIKLFAPILKHRDSTRGILSAVAHYLGPECHAITDDAIITRMILECPYADVILSFNVPELEMHGNYGNHIRIMVANSESTEQKIFGRSLLLSDLVLRDKSELFKLEYDSFQSLLEEFRKENSKSSLFPLLQGRIDVLKFIQSKSVRNQSILPFLLNREKAGVYYFKSIIPLLVLRGEHLAVREIFDHYSLLAKPARNWFERAIKNQWKIAEFWLRTEEEGVSTTKWTKFSKEIEEFSWPKDLKEISKLMMDEVKKNLKR